MFNWFTYVVNHFHGMNYSICVFLYVSLIFVEGIAKAKCFGTIYEREKLAKRIFIIFM